MGLVPVLRLFDDDRRLSGRAPSSAGWLWLSVAHPRRGLPSSDRVGVAVRSSDRGLAVVDGYPPMMSVDEDMMAATEQAAVVDRCDTSFAPGGAVMDVGPRW